MATYWHVIFYSLIGGLVSLAGGALLLRNKSSARVLAYYATPFAAGALLAAVFLDLLKEGIHESEADTVLVAALIGILLFFFAERFLRWFHHHHEYEDEEAASKSLIVVGDTMHNVLDGVAIAAGFLISVPTGIVTTLAVAAHEIPQEIGDFGLLLKKGMPRRKVLLVNAMSALATTVAAVVTFALGSEEKLPIGVLLGLSAGFLLYIAMSDVIPSIHEHATKKKLLDWQPLLLLVGVLTVGAVINLSHRYVDTEHTETTQETAMPSTSHGPTYEIADHTVTPSIALELKPDSKMGYNLLTKTTNFMFDPDNVGNAPQVGTGHSHVYVNGVKVGRVYSSAYHLPDVKAGDVVRVTLNANDHKEISHDGEVIEATVTAGAVTTYSEDSAASPSHGDSMH